MLKAESNLQMIDLIVSECKSKVRDKEFLVNN